MWWKHEQSLIEKKFKYKYNRCVERDWILGLSVPSDDLLREEYQYIIELNKNSNILHYNTRQQRAEHLRSVKHPDIKKRSRIIRALSDMLLADMPLYNTDLSILSSVLRIKYNFERNDILKFLAIALKNSSRHDSNDAMMNSAIIQLKYFLNTERIDESIRSAILDMIDSPDTSKRYKLELAEFVAESPAKIDIDTVLKATGTRLNKEVRFYLKGLSAKNQKPWIDLFFHFMKISGSKPSAKWINAGRDMVSAIGEDVYFRKIKDWMPFFRINFSRIDMSYHMRELSLKELDTHLGLLYLSYNYEDLDLAVMFADMVKFGYRNTEYFQRHANACISNLGRMPGPQGLTHLAILKSQIKHRNALKEIDKIVAHAASRIGLTQRQLEDQLVQDYGLMPGGTGSFAFGDFTLSIEIESTNKINQNWLNVAGKQQKNVPKGVKDNHADELKEVRANLKEMQKALRAQRERIDMFLRQKVSWPFADWKQHYLDHGLTGWIARRLIWRFVDDQNDELAAWNGERMVNIEGQPLNWPGVGTTVQLYHPIDHDQDTVVAWREWIFERKIRQPFKQAFREIYILTDAEVNTRIYSNRFAAHILNAGHFAALARTRLWKTPAFGGWDGGYEGTPQIKLPDWKLRAEFWVDVAGEDISDIGLFRHLATDQVRFCDDNGDAIPLGQIPARLFSEVMRDVDMFVGVASIGNDPTWVDSGGARGPNHYHYWQDYAFGELKESAQSRKQMLERLITGLKIADRVKLDGKFLVVRGDIRTYKIHLGSSNIMMEPGNQYLCIVPESRSSAVDRVYLPFEGDRILSVILSKAFMLAEDTKIKDPAIISQINRSV